MRALRTARTAVIDNAARAVLSSMRRGDAIPGTSSPSRTAPAFHASLAFLTISAAFVSFAMLAPDCVRAQSDDAPEVASGFTQRPAVDARRMMIATANPLASAAGLAMLRRGGSAVDAAIAAQMVLNLVEPQSSGIGGGAFLMHWDPRQQEVSAWDGRETAPAAASDALFLDAAGKPLRFFEAVVGGRAVGVPGVLRMLEAAHRRHGKLAWRTLFDPAIRLAKNGFAVSPRLHALLANDRHLARDPDAARTYYDRNSAPWPVGHVLRNPAFARTLTRIARQGADAFYTGQIGAAIVAKVRAHPTNPGLLSADDLRHYTAVQRDPVCAPWRVWVVCGMPPPSSGGIAVAQILGMLTHTAIAQYPPQAGVPSAEAVHLFSEAGRLAFADRAKYIADPAFVRPPAGLLDPAYLAERAALIGARSLGRAPAGVPKGVRVALADDHSADRPGTSHLSVVDARGNALAMTSSIENAFGSRQMVGGFLLNNQLTDFSFVPTEQGAPVANRVEPGKRPRSSMSPTLVFEADVAGKPQRLVMSLGAPGGPTIINFVAKTLVATFEWHLDVQDAIALINFGSRNGPTDLERGRLAPADEAALIGALEARGHSIRPSDQVSGVQAIMRTERGWRGGTDPRREGMALGD